MTNFEKTIQNKESLALELCQRQCSHEFCCYDKKCYIRCKPSYELILDWLNNQVDGDD